ncbi:MAG TPA: antitoxin Xre/MbcA/ParS toxin-binding domain-containing protein [Gammaproteobacteria bacterium]|nr:antitoxin Xre/MbcA/ParS toxin-binding domain-containing protein [Gammaproteobacteria bacterium]
MEQGEGIYELLGGQELFPQPPGGPLQWDELIRENRVPWAAVDHFKATLAASNQVMAEILGVGSRTLSGRHDPDETLKAAVADRLYRAAQVFAQAEAVFGSREAAREWLTTPQRGLGNAVPLSLLATHAGLNQVQDLLGRIEYGLPA